MPATVLRLCSRLLGERRICGPILSQYQQQCRSITSKSMRGGPRVITHKPFPYEEKTYGVIWSIFDKTLFRMNENSKMIVVEGPIAAGKTQLAKELAEELEMLHVPEATMDLYYINPYGYDMRQLDPQLPDQCKSFDVEKFCNNPNHPLAATFQIQMYMLRYEQYVDAIIHILSTGQGVVLERSCFSDFVFLETMYKHGYISKGARSVYNEIVQNTLSELLKPHLVIYLDVPVKTIQERIKERGIDYEVNSKVFTDKYLSDMEMSYKQQYLKEISVHAELLIYDWSSYGESEVVVEDIERMDFDQFERDRETKKMKDWRFYNDGEACEARIKYCRDKSDLLNFFNIPRYDVPELVRDGESSQKYREVWFNAPGMKYHPGYNVDMGDTGLLTKTKMIKRHDRY